LIYAILRIKFAPTKTKMKHNFTFALAILAIFFTSCSNPETAASSEVADTTAVAVDTVVVDTTSAIVSDTLSIDSAEVTASK